MVLKLQYHGTVALKLTWVLYRQVKRFKILSIWHYLDYCNSTPAPVLITPTRHPVFNPVSLRTPRLRIERKCR